MVGLDPVNLERMARGEPVELNLRNIDPGGPTTVLPDIDIVIAATDTDDWRRFAHAIPGAVKPQYEPDEIFDEVNAPVACRVCGCTDDDCSGCIAKTGQPCHWVESDLCSACA
jgi:hypothetical protein